MTVYAIIVAAGRGQRFKGKKQFYPLHGKPLLIYTLKAFEKNKKIHSITLVVPKNDLRLTRNMVRRFNYRKIRAIVAGGKRRQDSVLNGFRTIMNKKGIVIVHDGARPLVSSSILNQGIKLCTRYRCVTSGVPITDTIKLVHKNNVARTIPRNGLYQIQTPQFFDINLMRNAYEKIKFSDDFTDEASIIEAFGASVHILMGNRMNLKITDRNDLELFKKLLR